MVNYITIIVIVLCMHVTVNTCQPVGPFPQETELHQDTTETDTLCNKIYDVIRTWLMKMTSRLYGPSQDTLERMKRDARGNDTNHVLDGNNLLYSKDKNDTSFENYEKVYLVEQTVQYLKGIYLYSEYVDQLNHDNKAFNHVMEEKMAELMAMTTVELEDVFQKVKSAAAGGVTDPGISRICCLQG